VVNENRADYVKSWDEVQFLPGAFQALRRLSATAFRIVLVTNQSPIGRGILTRTEVEAINRRLVGEIEARGGRVDRAYYCPHHPDDGCACRKPQPGMLLQAAQELDLDLAGSYLVGDAVSDVEAALAAGCLPILVLSGRGRQQQAVLRGRGYPGVLVAEDLTEAVDYILDGHRRGNSQEKPI
jgi:D-glycero-D-manno-heptose 1,7-bisphosphate phosphatase